MRCGGRDRFGFGLGILLAALLVFAVSARADEGGSGLSNAATAHELPEVEVIGTAPLPGLGSPRNEVPANVQTLNSADLQRQQSLGLADYLNDNFSGVNVNDTQDNPFQPDVNYHGFTASPLLGTPEGLSVYVDGVRVNESFGDVVNWDLIPESAISTVTLIPGSNPVFGLNTLGGALSIQTKSGSEYPGTELQTSGGSFGRRDFQAQTGGSLGHFDYFLTGNYFDGNGWRDLSPSHVRQLFGKVGWQNDSTDVDLSYTWADTNLAGNGATPQSLVDYRRASIFTAPDSTDNHLNFVNLTGTHFLTAALLLSGNVYYRQLQTRSMNGDISDDYADDYGTMTAPGGACAGASDPNACAAAALADSNGIDNASTLIQRTLGAGLQLTATPKIFGLDNQAVVGTDFSRSRDQFAQTQQQAVLTPNHSTQATGPSAPNIDLHGINQSFGAYLTDTLSPTGWLHLITSARYNRNVETLNGVNIAPDTGVRSPLTGDHSFHRLNPAFGFTVTPSKALTLFADYNEGSRSPTVIELGCANPVAPCGLPNAFAGDPPLQQVVARTFETGAHGPLYGRWLQWSLDLFHTRSGHDIQFITTSTLNGQGYFDNVGTTRRQGGDLGLGGAAGDLTWHLVYSFVDATYQSSFDVPSASNSTGSAGFIAVNPGDRIPLIPRHTGRLVLDYAVVPQWHVGANLIVSSGAYLRGNENNEASVGGADADGHLYLGSGRIGGYAVLNLRTDLAVSPNVDLFLRVVNVFDRHYATSGLLSQNVFNPDGSFRSNPADWTNENAISPATPRAAWLGLRVRWK